MRQLVPTMGGLLAGLAGGSAVLLGAFGAHTLRNVLDSAHSELWHTAVMYHFWHALALTISATNRGRASTVAMYAFAIGIGLFCGSLYALALCAARSLGLITPVGGVAFLIGWIALGMSLHQQSKYH